MSKFTQQEVKQYDNGAYGSCPHCSNYNNNCTAINDTYDVTYEIDPITGEATELERTYISTTFDYPICSHCGKDTTPIRRHYHVCSK